MYRSVLGFLFLFLALNLSKLTAQCITNVDFNNWNQAGDPANGNWTVQSGGSQIYQSINGQPTYFLSSFDLINVEITGQFRTDNGDDDFMGFVIGFNDPIGNNTDHDYILFDWKGVAQTYLGNHAPTGMTLSRVQGNIPVSVPVYAQYFWGHANSIPPLEVLDTHYGAGLGWVQGVDHDFRCIYTPTNIKIFVDGNLIFDVDDCFKAGRFGFYNYSQPQVTYTDFTYELATAFQVEEQNICLVDSASFIFIDACAANFNFNLIDEMEWDFGDGNSYTNSNPDAQNINPKHLYTAPGNYQV
ncbi:MAG: PKD domain-containing protein, partial [Chitinophagales bacterium]